MAIYFSSVFGSASIGVYLLATDKMIIVPKSFPAKKAERLSEWLKVKLLHTSIGGSVLVGALACANSNGILVPHFVAPEEVKSIKSVFKGNIAIMEKKKTAFGNMVLVNDKGAIADPRLKESETREISDILGVDVLSGEIAGLPYVGSLGVATNKGVVVHPLLKDTERKVLEEALKVPVDVGTVNCGIPYVGTGLIGNRHAAIVGPLTTGPETVMIENALDIVKEDE